MTDFQGNELNVGDKVIFIHKKYYYPVQKLIEGKIVRLTKEKVEIEYESLGSVGNKITRTEKVLKGFPEYQLFKLG